MAVSHISQLELVLFRQASRPRAFRFVEERGRDHIWLRAFQTETITEVPEQPSHRIRRAVRITAIDDFPRRLIACCRPSQRTFTGRAALGRCAPSAILARDTSGQQGWTEYGHSQPADLKLANT
jgi:hypothetical protein